MTQPTPLVAAANAKPRRRLSRLIAGILGMLITALGAFFLVNQLQHQQDVVVIRQSVPRGQVITDASVGTLTTSQLPGVDVIPASRLSEVVGKRAGADLTAGSLLSQAQLATTPMPPPGEVLIGLRLTPGRVPASELGPGAPIRLVVTNPEQTDPAFRDAYTNKAYDAVAVSVKPSIDGQTTLVDVTTAQASANEVGTLAAAGRLTVIQVGP